MANTVISSHGQLIVAVTTDAVHVDSYPSNTNPELGSRTRTRTLVLKTNTTIKFAAKTQRVANYWLHAYKVP